MLLELIEISNTVVWVAKAKEESDANLLLSQQQHSARTPYFVATEYAV